MMSWLAETLRTYPELAIFFALAIDSGSAEAARRLQPRQCHCYAPCGGRDRPARHPGAGSDQVRIFPDVPVRRGLRRGTTVFPWPRKDGRSRSSSP